MIDPTGTRAYAANPARDRVEVIALATATLEAPIPVGDAPLGLDLSSDGTKLYVALRAEVGRIAMPPDSGSLDWRPFSVAVANDGSALVSRVADADAGKALLRLDRATGTMTEVPPFLAGLNRVATGTRVEPSDDRSSILIAEVNSSGGSVFRYDVATRTIEHKYLQTYLGFSAADRTGSKLVVNAGQGSFVLDDDLVVRATVPVDSMGVAVNGAGTIAYRVQEQQVEVLDLDRGLDTRMIPLPEPVGNALGVPALTPNEQTVVVTTATGLSIVATSDAVPVPGCVPTLADLCSGTSPAQVVVDPTGTRAYRANRARNQIDVINLATKALEAPIVVGSQPRAMDFSAGGSTLYVANAGANDISVVDLALRKEVRRITTPAGFDNERPFSIAVASNGTALVTTSDGGGGWTDLLQVNLGDDSIRVRGDYGNFGYVTGLTTLAAGGDRSRIGMANGNISNGAIARYQVSTDAFVESQVDEFIESVALDRTGDSVLVDNLVLDGNLTLHTSVLANERNAVAVSGDGNRAYLQRERSFDVVDVKRGLVIGSIEVGQDLGQGRAARLRPPAAPGRLHTGRRRPRHRDARSAHICG
ncbi:MAG: YncE family protein [Acidimicrobiales bacterium]